MASNYPASADSFDTIAADKKQSDAVGGRTHRVMHNDLGDAIEAVQTELGATPSGSESTVAARLDKIEDGTRLAANSVGATQLADNAVDTNAIQAKAVTAAKIADDTITATQIAANAVGSSELADSAVDTAAIADSAVTSAKIADGTITGTDVAASTFAAFGTVGNLLTANQATGTDAATFAPTNATQSGATFTATATAAMSAQYANFPATPGDTYTAFAKLTATGRANTISLNFRDSGGTQLANLNSSTVAAGTSGEVSVTAVAPAGTATVRVYLLSGGYTGNSGDTVAFTKVGLWRGAAGTWSLPGTPIVGQSHIATNGAVHLSGTGTPEGVVTAAPCSTWLDVSSVLDVSGWARYEKLSGISNTGWALGAGYDSGSRDLSGVTMSNSWAVSGSLFKLQRVGRTVSIDAAFTKASASADAAYTLPVGFRPLQATVRRICNTDTADDFVTVSITSAGVISIVRSSMSSNIVYLSLSFLTPTTAPSSLPGTDPA